MSLKAQHDPNKSKKFALALGMPTAWDAVQLRTQPQAEPKNEANL